MNPLLFGLLVLLQVGDIVTTKIILRRGGVEKNPLMRSIVTRLPVFILVKLGYLALVWGFGWVLGTYDPLAESLFLGSNVVACLWIVTHNLREL